MIRQTVFPFKLEKTEEELTAQGGLALFAEYNHGMGLRNLSDRYLPEAGSNRGYTASAFVDTLVMMLQAGGRCLEDARELRRETALLGLVEREEIPDPDTADQDAAVKAAIRAIPSADWGEPEPGCGFEVAETAHCMNRTEKAFRLIVFWRQSRAQQTPKSSSLISIAVLGS